MRLATPSRSPQKKGNCYFVDCVRNGGKVSLLKRLFESTDLVLTLCAHQDVLRPTPHLHFPLNLQPRVNTRINSLVYNISWRVPTSYCKPLIQLDRKSGKPSPCPIACLHCLRKALVTTGYRLIGDRHQTSHRGWMGSCEALRSFSHRTLHFVASQ